jgi:hypothetical protein
MAGAKDPQSSALHPVEQAPVPDVMESEADPGLGRGDRYLREERVSSGNLSDDPTDSGEPVRNRKSFSNLKGGR